LFLVAAAQCAEDDDAGGRRRRRSGRRRRAWGTPLGPLGFSLYWGAVRHSWLRCAWRGWSGKGVAEGIRSLGRLSASTRTGSRRAGREGGRRSGPAGAGWWPTDRQRRAPRRGVATAPSRSDQSRPRGLLGSVIRDGAVGRPRKGNCQSAQRGSRWRTQHACPACPAVHPNWFDDRPSLLRRRRRVCLAPSTAALGRGRKYQRSGRSVAQWPIRAFMVRGANSDLEGRRLRYQHALTADLSPRGGIRGTPAGIGAPVGPPSTASNDVRGLGLPALGDVTVPIVDLGVPQRPTDAASRRKTAAPPTAAPPASVDLGSAATATLPAKRKPNDKYVDRSAQRGRCGALVFILSWLQQRFGPSCAK